MVKTFINKKYYIFLLFFIILVIFLLYNKGSYIKNILMGIFKNKEGFTPGDRQDRPPHPPNVPSGGHTGMPIGSYAPGQDPNSPKNIIKMYGDGSHILYDSTKTMHFKVGGDILTPPQIFFSLLNRYNDQGDPGAFDFAKFAFNGNFASELPNTVEDLENIVYSSEFINWIKDGSRKNYTTNDGDVKSISFDDVKDVLNLNKDNINTAVDFNNTDSFNIKNPLVLNGTQKLKAFPGGGDLGKLMELFKDVNGYMVKTLSHGGDLIGNTKAPPGSADGTFYTLENDKYRTANWSKELDPDFSFHFGNKAQLAGNPTMDDLDRRAGTLLTNYREKVNDLFTFYKHLQLELKRIEKINLSNSSNTKLKDNNGISINDNTNPVIQASPSYGYPVMIEPEPIEFMVSVVNSTNNNIDTGAPGFGCTFLTKDKTAQSNSFKVRTYEKRGNYFDTESNKMNVTTADIDCDKQPKNIIDCFNGERVSLLDGAAQCILNSHNNNRFTSMNINMATQSRNKCDQFTGKYRRDVLINIDDGSVENVNPSFVMMEGENGVAKCVLDNAQNDMNDGFDGDYEAPSGAYITDFKQDNVPTANINNMDNIIYDGFGCSDIKSNGGTESVSTPNECYKQALQNKHSIMSLGEWNDGYMSNINEVNVTCNTYSSTSDVDNAFGRAEMLVDSDGVEIRSLAKTGGDDWAKLFNNLYCSKKEEDASPGSCPHYANRSNSNSKSLWNTSGITGATGNIIPGLGNWSDAVTTEDKQNAIKTLKDELYVAQPASTTRWGISTTPTTTPTSTPV